MRKYNDSTQKGRMSDHLLTEDFFKKIMSDDDIMLIQDTLLSPGLHYISASNSVLMRPIMSKFLEALGCFHAIAFLSRKELGIVPKSSLEIHEIYFDVMERMADQDFISDFFLNECQADFMWIEGASAFAAVTSIIIDVHLDQQIPIIIVG